MRPVVGDVNSIPEAELVVMTCRPFRKGELITHMPIDYVRIDDNDGVIDVVHNAMVREKAVLERFKAFVLAREDHAYVLRANSPQNIIFMPNTARKDRSGSFLGAFINENIWAPTWRKMSKFNAVATKIAEHLKAREDSAAFRLFYKAYLYEVITHTNAIISVTNVSSTAAVAVAAAAAAATSSSSTITKQHSSMVLPLINIVASRDVKENTPLVLELGIISAIYSLSDTVDAATVKRLLHAAYACNRGELRQTLVKELIDENSRQS